MSKYDIGNKFITNEGYEVEIIGSGTNRNIKKVKFLDEYGYEIETHYSSIQRGSIKNPYHKSVFGVGYLGVGNHKPTVDRKVTREYQIWKSMLQRCYYEKDRLNNKTYECCDVDKRWHCFQTFAEDIKDIPNLYSIDDEGNYFACDKDLLGIELYSKDTICFIPTKINNFLTNSKKVDKQLLTGVSKKYNKYEANIRIDSNVKYLGLFNTEEEAYECYVKARNERAKELAKKYKGKIEDRVYDALMNYNEETFI